MQPITVRHPDSSSEFIDVLSSATPVFTGPSQTRLFSPGHITKSVAAGQRRPEWTWVAVDDSGTTLGIVAAMSPFATYSGILVLDQHAASDPVVSEALYRQVVADIPHLNLTEPLEMTIQFDARPDALNDPDVRRLIDAAERAGFNVLVVRRRFELHADQVPAPLHTDLVFESPTSPEDPRLHTLMTSIMTNTLDVHDRHELATSSAEDYAQESLNWYLESDPLEGFSLAYNRNRQLVGLVIGSRWGTGDMGAVSFVGVHPDFRGHGYAAQLTSAKVNELFAQGITTLVGDTDEENTSMGNAFESAGFIQTETRIDLLPIT